MAGRKKSGFAFDLYQPLKKGVLLKQGAVHTAFKYRFFVLYPGFFVYYEKESKWRQDLTKGETLDSRIGAIKLVGGTCNYARGAPKGCKFGFTIHAPDPLNKRPTYLINATSKQDRDEWIDAIREATPTLGGHGATKRSMEEPVPRSSHSHPPPYSAGPSAGPYSDPVPPSFEKRQDIGTEFSPMSYNKPSSSSWQQQPNEISPRRVPEEPKRPAYPPRPPARYSPAANSGAGVERPKPLETSPAAAARKPPAPSWQQPVPVNVGPPRVPDEPKKQQPLKPRPPVRQYPAATPAASGGRGDTNGATESGDQWIKAIRKSTNTKPAWGASATSPTNSQGVESGQMEFKRARERLMNAMGGTSTSSPSPQKQRSTASPVKIRQEPKKPAPPPPPEEHEPSLYVNIGDIESDDDSSSDDDNPTQQPPPYVGPTNGAPRIMTPVNMEALGRQMGAAQRFIEKRGYLYKLGTKRKTWNLRYFVLRPGVFTYAKSAQSKVNEVVKLKNLQVFYPGSGERKTSYQFILHTESTWNKKADWTLAAQTESEMKDWILAFKLAGQSAL